MAASVQNKHHASIKIGNQTVKNSYEIASEFNKHFTSIGKQVEENLIKPKHKYSEYLRNPNASSFLILVYKIIRRELIGIGCQWLPVATNNLLIDYQCTIIALTKFLRIMIGTNW